MTAQLLKILRNSFLYDRLLRLRQYRDLFRWIESGKEGLTPHPIKQTTIREYARRFQINIFIETGTFYGEMIFAMRDTFSEIISIELSSPLYKRAVKKFRRYSHITIYQGDSTHILPEVIAGLKEPALFWLDGHYSAGISAKGAATTPIQQELNAIFSHPIGDHVILIDDARCFIGQDDYPRLDILKQSVFEKRPEFIFDANEDIIRIHPKMNKKGTVGMK